MRVIIVHHVAQKTVEMIKPALARVVFWFEAQVPFSNN